MKDPPRSALNSAKIVYVTVIQNRIEKQIIPFRRVLKRQKIKPVPGKILIGGVNGS